MIDKFNIDEICELTEINFFLKSNSYEQKLIELEKQVKKALEEEKKRKIRIFTKKLEKTKDNFLILLSQAIKFELLGENINSRELAYNLEKDYTEWYQYKLTKPVSEKQKLFIKSFDFLDIETFIMDRTHYDNFSNGRFWRMS